MRIIQITDRKQLNGFVAAQEHSQFLQSWEWGEFQEKVSGKIWRLGVEEPLTLQQNSGQEGSGQDEIVAVATLVKKSLPVGKSYFYCGRGPVIKQTTDNKQLTTELLFKEIEKLAKEEGVMFLRIDPLLELQTVSYKLQATLDVQPRETLILDLTKIEDELLKEMHQKTRYNIRLAEKKGVKIVEAGRERFEEFWYLLDQTSGRDKFRPHGRNYYEAMLEADKNFIKLFFAEYKNKLIAAGIFSFFGDSVTYLHGGSANEHREIMAPYFLQWRVIKLAKERGYKYFDFHGIDEKKWPGVTRFKKGFGGKEYNYPGTFDLIYDTDWYGVYKMIRKVRRTF